jgi:adenylate cyclase
VRDCFAALARLVAHVADYEREFGTAVQVRASLHCGPVVVGEMGSVEKEIALLGGTLNTAARLVDVCRDSGESVIASADLLDRLVLPPGVAARSLGRIRLRGKEQTIELCALVQATPGTRLMALWENGHIHSTCASGINCTVPNYMLSGPRRRDIKAGA